MEGILPVTNGGTGATTASDARTNLGLGNVATLNYDSSAETGYLKNDGTWDKPEVAVMPTYGMVMQDWSSIPFTTSDTLTAHTSNLNDLGAVATEGGYTDSDSWTKVLSATGASKLLAIAIIQSESTSYDWGCIWEGSNSSYTAANNYSTSLSGKLGGTTKTTKAYIINSDSCTVAWKSDSSQHNYYGFYVVVIPLYGTLSS